MTAFINALNKLATNSGLAIKSKHKTHKWGSLEYEIKLVSNPDNIYPDEHASLNFTEFNGEARINANVQELRLYSDSNKNEERLTRHEQAVALTKLIMASQEVKDTFLEAVHQVQSEINATREAELSKLSKDHEALTSETAQKLLKDMIEAVRAKHAEANANRRRSGYTEEAEASAETKIVHEDGSVERFTLRVSLKKRISYTLDLSGITKTELMSHLKGAYVSKDAPFSVR